AFFVGSQIALSVVLLVGAGLFLRSLRQGLALDPGFDPSGVVVARLDLGALGYDQARASAFFDDVVARLGSLEGVEAAALSDQVLLGAAYGRNTSDVRPVEEVPGGEPRLNAAISVVGPTYFSALGIDRVAGRGFSEADGPGATPVAVVNETMARRLWPGRNPVGRRFRQDGREFEVVGLVRDGKYTYVTEPPGPYGFRASAQNPRRAMILHVRSTLSPPRALGSIRGVVQDLDPDVALQGEAALSDVVTSTLFPQRFAAEVVGLFGLVGLAFGVVGIYGLLSFHVAQRSHEMGIRMALGARPRRLAGDVALRTVRLAVYGAIVGIALAALLSRALRGLMIGLSPLDPLTYAGVALTMILIAALASFPPARRATVVDPSAALREE
ncbi:MAG TPA: ABC transporter permease, partial [Longimicrobiales bacterium]|nr:ABC transporter permease [Longimicrobiales bacterium]